MGAKGKASDYYVFYHITWEKLGLAAANLCAAALEGFVFAELIRQLLYRMTERNLAGMKEILVLTAVSALVYLLFCCLDGYFGFRIRQRMQVACQDELFDRYLDSCNWEESFIRQVLGQLMTTLGTFAEDTVQLYRAMIRQKQILGSADTCLVVTHEMEHLELFDRVLVLREGQLVYDGTPSGWLSCHSQEKKI